MWGGCNATKNLPILIPQLRSLTTNQNAWMTDVVKPRFLFINAIVGNEDNSLTLNYIYNEK
jgi:hypothetical protein